MKCRNTTSAQPSSPTASPRTSTPKSQASDSQSTPRPRPGRKKASDASETKARRVRTGCLTCRQRHLKCDEAVGRCLNCRKSNRVCRRGVRLNFIDTQTVAPPHIIARPDGSKVTFRDDSRMIASLYVGGFEIYPPVQPESPVQENRPSPPELDVMRPDDLTSLFQSVAHSFDPLGFDVSQPSTTDFIGTDTWSQSHLVPGDELLPHGTSDFARKLAGRPEYYTFLTDPEHVSLLKAFAEEVGPRMDILDDMNHFSQILPNFAVSEPILLKAFLACGARYLSLVDSSYGVGKAINYYNEATQDLLNAIHDANRDSVLCATAALSLGFFESMSAQLPNNRDHIAGSRALIRECGWTAKTPGLGGACFRISLTTELLNCMRHNWTVSWDPNTWGISMNMDHAQCINGSNQDLWYHRILYIFAKALNFRASAHPNHGFEKESTTPNMQLREQEWVLYNRWCEQWAKSVPRSLAPLSYLQPWQTNTRSVFPGVWLIQRSAIVARLFYHATRILLAKANPFQSEFDEEMWKMQCSHANEICGLIAHTKERGVADISLRFLAFAAECLHIREAQEEVIGIIDTITKVTGSNPEPTKNDLKQIWSWAEAHPHTVIPAQMHNHFYELDPSLLISEHPVSPPILNNLLLTKGDFSLENHPYQGYYVPPHHHHALNQYHYGAFDLI